MPAEADSGAADTLFEDGIVYVGGSLSVENLENAYRNGVFPWPVDDPEVPMLWHCPDPRGILDFQARSGLAKQRIVDKQVIERSYALG